MLKGIKTPPIPTDSIYKKLIKIKHMKSLVNNLIFRSFILVFISSCSFQPKDSNNSITHNVNADCIIQKESVERKVQLESGIRGQVKFLGEDENFSSISDKMS